MLDKQLLKKIDDEYKLAGDSHVFCCKNYSYFCERLSSAYVRMKNYLPNSVFNGVSLDIGCGAGTGVAASLCLGGELAVGIDIDINSHYPRLNIDDYDETLYNLGCNPKKSLIINMDVFNAFFKKNTFDYITFIDAIEHIPDILYFLRWSYEALKPGGFILIDTLPLYYSPQGHHLWTAFTEEDYPWVHLRKDFREKFAKALPNESFEQWDKDLNKATHQDIRDALVAAGFDIIFEHRDHPHIHPGRYEKFLKVKDSLDLTNINESWLFEARIILTGKK